MSQFREFRLFLRIERKDMPNKKSTIILKNPDMVKYLQIIVRVNNIKWLYQTCGKHLEKFLLVPLLMKCNFQQNLIFF